MATPFLSNRILTIVMHIGAWALLFGLPFWLNPRFIIYAPAPVELPITPSPLLAITVVAMANLLFIAFFYLNYYVLLPKIWYQHNIKWYLLAIIVSFFCLYFMADVLVSHFVDKSMSPPVIPGLLLMTFVVAVSLALRITMDRTKEKNALEAREKETLKSELSFLRSQISPHFLFNVMNNIVALSRVKPHLVEPTLIQLSQLMRYMLYESDEKKVAIEQEIEYIENYINLQKMRFGDAVAIVFDKKMDDTSANIFIEPMLLIPFVENAFKHGIGMIKDPKITLQLFIQNNILIFNVFNQVSAHDAAKDGTSGIGLKNVSRRLALLYHEAHSLTIVSKEVDFIVYLTINFDKNALLNRR